MSLPLPSTLSPSKVSSFKDCALAFRFSAIDRLPELPSAPAAKGTLVHKALELLFWDHPQGGRTAAAAAGCVDRAWAELAGTEEMAELGLTAEEEAGMRADAGALVAALFRLEDPDGVTVLGTELMVEAPLGPMRLRGIIDRLERDGEGRLVVTDYKTGRVPPRTHEQSRLGGVHFYAYLCEKALGVRPDLVQLHYLAEPVSISTIPSDQSIRGLAVRAGAVWTAVEKACRLEDFRPRPSALCDWCAYKAFCPAWGGDPASARAAAASDSDATAGAHTACAQPALS